MKRLHIHIGVDSLDAAIQFYSALFGEQPTKTKGDYAKWMLEDPRINFAISTRAEKGIRHLGFQVDEANELEALRQRVAAAELATYDNGQVSCCYARSDKTWVTDPAGVPWENFLTKEDTNQFGDNRPEEANPCCAPNADAQNEAPKETATACCG